jgi:long-chain fatty acid transport protein
MFKVTRHRAAAPVPLTFAVGLAAGLMAAAPAGATDGYFTNGYGVQSKGMAGAGLAYPKDSLALASNPAAATALGDRWDVGLDLFKADRRAAFRGTAQDASFSGDGKSVSVIPEAGLVRQLNDRIAVGLVAYGNGGMVTSYENNPYARFGAVGAAGVELQQLFVSPTVAYRFAEGHSVGLALNLAGQTFRARGLGPFAGFSQAPDAFTNRGTDTAVGYGVRLGYLGQLTERLSVGAFWQSKTDFERFDKYRGLFAGDGDFDAPSAYGVGVAFKATPKLDLVADWRRIELSKVAPVGRPLAPLFAGKLFGAADGPGFGWRDVDAVKIGFNYRIDETWQVRAGYDRVENPVPADQTLLNIVAPAVVKDHFAIGATWTRPSGLELSGYAQYAPKKTVRGRGSVPAMLGGGEVDISMGEAMIGIALGWKH